jgi:hypothetical protein
LRITILGKTRCVLLHFDGSKHCVCPLYKFLYAFKVVKLFLKHPVYWAAYTLKMVTWWLYCMPECCKLHRVTQQNHRSWYHTSDTDHEYAGQVSARHCYTLDMRVLTLNQPGCHLNFSTWIMKNVLFELKRITFWNKLHFEENETFWITFKVCKSVHHRTFQINQPNWCNSFSSLLLDVYVQLNMFWKSSRPSSGAQQLQ